MENLVNDSISFISSKHSDEEHGMYWEIESIEIIIYDKPDKVIKGLFESPLNKQVGLETWIRSSDIIFDCVNLLHYKCHKINLKRVG